MLMAFAKYMGTINSKIIFSFKFRKVKMIDSIKRDGFYEH